MKRKYEKPRIIIENFITNDSFAAGCSTILTFSLDCGTTGNPNVDTVIHKGVFTDICEWPSEQDKYNGFCYHTVSNPLMTS